MCLIIATTKPTAIPKEVCESAASDNPDGIGFLWFDDSGRVLSRRLLNVPLRLWWPEFQGYAEEAEKTGSEFAIHFRLATHGAVSESMCHPYYMRARNGRAWLMHNGILRQYSFGKTKTKRHNGQKRAGTAVEDFSDTWHYARKLEKKLLHFGAEILYREDEMESIAEEIGSGNRMLFAVDNSESLRFSIPAPDTWHEIDGHRFSNLYAWDTSLLRKGFPGGSIKFSNQAAKNFSPKTAAEAKQFLYSRTEKDIVEALLSARARATTLTVNGNIPTILEALELHKTKKSAFFPFVLRNANKLALELFLNAGSA